MRFTTRTIQTTLILGLLLGSFASAAADDEYRMTLTVHSITIFDDHESLDNTGEIFFVIKINGVEEYKSPENSIKVDQKFLIEFEMTRFVSSTSRVTIEVWESDGSNSNDALGFIVVPLENTTNSMITNDPSDAKIEFTVKVIPTVRTVTTTTTDTVDLRIPLIAIISLVTIYFLLKVLFPEHTTWIPPYRRIIK